MFLSFYDVLLVYNLYIFGLNHKCSATSFGNGPLSCANSITPEKKLAGDGLTK